MEIQHLESLLAAKAEVDAAFAAHVAQMVRRCKEEQETGHDPSSASDPQAHRTHVVLKDAMSELHEAIG